MSEGQVSALLLWLVLLAFSLNASLLRTLPPTRSTSTSAWGAPSS